MAKSLKGVAYSEPKHCGPQMDTPEPNCTIEDVTGFVASTSDVLLEAMSVAARVRYVLDGKGEGGDDPKPCRVGLLGKMNDNLSAARAVLDELRQIERLVGGNDCKGE